LHATGSTLSVTPKRPPQSADSLLDMILTTLDDGKAEDVVSLPLDGKSTLADYMVIASGRSARQVAAIAERILSSLKDSGYGRVRVEGLSQADWVLVDAGDVILHIFRPDVRSFYNLEKMWGADLAQDGLTH